jgi:Ca2+-binding EF-hand superfamily protein
LVSLSLAALTVTAASAALDDAKVEAAMKQADPDSDGTLDLKEATKLGISKSVFMKVNADKDGTLDKTELAAAVSAQFLAADPDNDGTLDWKEAKKAGIKTKKAFDAADPDKDGTLDLNEYLAALVSQLK